MTKSEAFARIKAQVLRIVTTIPESKITTYQSIGEHLAVMPRHVAYILSQLDDNAKMDVPWYRVVSGDGSLGVPKRDPNGDPQACLLEREGIAVVGNAVHPSLEAFFLPCHELGHGIPRQERRAATPARAVDAGARNACGVTDNGGR
ncbi:MGMT family protein [Cyanobium gracile]|uniref:Putative methylated DNA-protein cysteine methyltransferase n=1 Tax=Cyanobium gracile (strain ATCC 27147 / PCC 6307) TaxID=292564 RepID=K9PAL3_CYAGP|nr:MGMT family protein [Cyanobium gracile]AFY30170.1 putative methylated DNA-protein cysteine methyltransferase [Cyanobium gracile PCC 6307]